MPPANFRWMTADEWDTSSNLWLMLHNAIERTGDQRKLCLFGVAACRRFWSFLPPESQALLNEFEAMLDSLSAPSSGDICEAGGLLCHRANAAVGMVQPIDASTDKLRVAAAKAVCYAVIGSPWAAAAYFTEIQPSEKYHQILLLKDIVGNPFRPIVMNPAWRTPAVLSLGQRIYDEQDYSLLSVCGDALEDAGCENDELLHHCRSGEPHVRGCWALDGTSEILIHRIRLQWSVAS